MSKKALYRTNVAIVETYSGWVDGESATWVSPIAWTKGNLQPYKQGVMSSIDEAGVMFKDWRVLYIKTLPEVDYSTAEYKRMTDAQKVKKIKKIVNDNYNDAKEDIIKASALKGN